MHPNREATTQPQFTFSYNIPGLTPDNPHTNPSKKEQVRGMFNAIAPRYDLLNHLLSLGIDRRWRARVVRMAAAALHPGSNRGKTPAQASAEGRPGEPDTRPGTPTAEQTHTGIMASSGSAPRILDVATGTGDLAIALARRGFAVTGVDLSAEMLAVGRGKVAKTGLPIEMVEGDAEQLPFADGTFDGVTAGFGVRNFGDLQAGLCEMHRVVRPGGRIFVLEFSMPRRRSLLGVFYRIYFRRILPAVGRLISRDKGAYRYLPDSVESFPHGAAFETEMAAAGFSAPISKKLMGGIASIYTAHRG